MAEVKQKKEKSQARKIIEWVGTGVLTLLVAVIVFFNVVGMVTRKDNYDVPNYFGIQTLVVLTDSMVPSEEGDKGYEVGSTVIVQKVDPSTIKVGDDLTFMWNVNGRLTPMTHRCSDIQTATDASGNITYTFTCHGINKKSEFCKIGDVYGDCTDQLQVFNQDVLLGKVIGKSAFLGFFYNFVSSWWGLLIMLLIPALYLIITSVIDIVKAPDEDKKVLVEGKEEKKDKNSSFDDEERARLKQEMLNQMIEEKMQAKLKEKQEKENQEKQE